nr:hypothetical protein [Streptomyces sp. CRN 30]
MREITSSGRRPHVLISCGRVPDLIAEIIPHAAAELDLTDGTAV